MEPQPHLSDDALMRRAATLDDPGAFACLVRRHQAKVIGFAVRMLSGDREAGADIAQESFIRLWEARKKYVPSGRFVSYLLRISYTLCLSRRRSPSEKVVPLEGLEKTAAQSVPMELPMIVRDALFELSEEQRTVFILHEYVGLTYDEISDTLYIAVGTVASRKHAAVQTLRKLLAPYLEDNEGTTSR